MTDPESELEGVFARMRSREAPAEDRARISGRLREQLGSAALGEAAAGGRPATADGRGLNSVGTPEMAPSGMAASLGSAPQPPALVRAGTVTSRSGWIQALVATAVISGALGLVAGYELRSHDLAAHDLAARDLAARDLGEGQASTADRSEAIASTATPAAPMDLPAAAMDLPAARMDLPTTPEPSQGVVETARRELEAPEAATHERSAPSKRRPTDEGRSKAGAPLPASRFSELVERLRRAHRALENDRPSAALIELDAIDRFAGDALRDERDLTHVLAFCALGEVEGARRAAARLRSAGDRSIYAERLRQSCVGMDGSP